ncbi:GPI-inositol-deacylase [Crucibulum laeve]|uniref:GPI inositol-deacylase n=1 Tax=Crucibulum laeve TaxID=68775 RepID=A0A5C3MRB8_9AGAR|nr:GPI-inositol-deacylase [Crucibulum laeve]
MSVFTHALGITSLLAVLLFFIAGSDIAQNLSPQGCRMSRMSPSYVLQQGFDASWTPLARRYTLWLYREVGWDPIQVSSLLLQGLPVLFIPGNAGSSNQVRSIASSATRQFYSMPGRIAPEFASRSLKPLDFFAVDFNEDLSAFHGPTLESEIKYTSQAVSYIISLYPKNTPIIIMGHSMGGIVADALLPSTNISAVITMSTPHTLPPARFDSRIDDLYSTIQRTLRNDPTPIVSLCGGATDSMIPSESCVLPPIHNTTLRRTVFSSALEGAWTGIGHREMVWCHQVRWRVARAALEIGASHTADGRARILDDWLRDGHTLPPAITESPASREELRLTDPAQYEVHEELTLVLRKPQGSQVYLLPLPKDTSQAAKFTLFVSQGAIPPVSPQNALPLRVAIFKCTSQGSLSQNVPRCGPLKPTTLKLVPNPVPGKVFPIPDEGSDESEGVVLYEADILPLPESLDHRSWIGVKINGADGRGWVFGGFEQGTTTVNDVGTFSLLFGRASVTIPNRNALHTTITFPNLLSNALVVYRVDSIKDIESDCADPLLPPLLAHTSHSVETHYFPLSGQQDRRLLLHTHIPAPYIPRSPLQATHGLNFTIYSSSAIGCGKDVHALHISIDWRGTLGRWASRYLSTLVSWAAGVSALVLFYARTAVDYGGKFIFLPAMPTVTESLAIYGRQMIHQLLPLSLVVAFLPLPEIYFLGNTGEPLLAPIGPLILLIASGLVCVSWWILSALLLAIGKVSKAAFGRRREKTSIHRTTLFSMGLIFLAIFLFIPWQVAFLGCWLYHVHTCASTMQQDSQGSSSTDIPLLSRADDAEPDDLRSDAPVPDRILEQKPWQEQETKRNNLNHNMHLLLFMTWLLPLVAPVLAVWVKTLVTAGLTTPFDGDHVFLNVIPFLVLVDFTSWNSGVLFERQNFERRMSLRWLFMLIAMTAFFVGARRPYNVFDAAKIAVGVIVVVQVGQRYWGGASWPSVQVLNGRR